MALYIVIIFVIIFFIAFFFYQAGKNKVVIKNLKGLNDVSRKSKKIRDDISNMSDDDLNNLL